METAEATEMAETTQEPATAQSRTTTGQVPLTWSPATEADAPALSALVESAYRGEGSRAGWTTEADLLGGQRMDVDMAREMVGASGTVVLLFRPEGTDSGDRPVACVQLERKDGNVAYFGTFAVDPTQQGGGIGKRVMAVAEDYARQQWSATRMRMMVIRQRDDLIAYYERRGFAPTGEREPFPYGQEQFGKPRRDDLEFIVLEKPLD
jgi:GNAT superfamily N-acetyltransferase